MNWRLFLEEVSKTLIKSGDLLEEYRVNASDWLGFKPATEQEIRDTEARLGVMLPPSYKAFLRTSNGFKQLDCFIWDFLPAHQIDWLKEFDPEFTNLYETEFNNKNEIPDEIYDDYSEEQSSVYFRTKYLVNSLAVSDWGDSAIVVLNPEVKFGEEWEAWIFANWYPGARRYKSFEDLMKNEYQSYMNLLQE